MSKLLSFLKETFNRSSLTSAVSMGAETWTYLQLDQNSDAIAQNLVQKYAIKTNDIVAVTLPKSLEQIALLIALVKIGATYLPVDQDLPEQRITFILSHSKAKLLITPEVLKSLFETPIHFLTLPQPKEHHFYLLYTSGSTGTPKGVVMGSQSLHHLLEWQTQETRLKEKSITLQFSPLSFDVHFQEIFGTFASGGHLVLVSESDRKDMAKLINIINERGINRLYLPFVAMNLMAEISLRTDKNLPSVREITVAGEQLKITPYIRRFMANHSEAVLFNHYGPTETHVVTSLKLDRKTSAVSLWPELPSIGVPTGTNQILIVDAELKPVTDGSTGEILIAGLALAEGYYLNAEETEKRFFTHPQFGRVYRTNDLAKKLSNGEIEFCGRNDRQIKIRGYRIELGEIEAQVLKVCEALSCAVVPITVNNSTYLKGIVSGTKLNSSEIKSALKLVIPDYMIPEIIEVQNQLPLTPSGKIDYLTLTSTTTEQKSLLQDKIKAIWKKHLPIAEFDLTTSFFDLGGHSISLAQMLLDINETLNINLDLVDVFENSTIEKLAVICDKAVIEIAVKPKKIKQNGTQAKEKIAIIAAHGHFPDSVDVQAFWKNLLAKKNLVKSFDPSLIHPLTTVSDSHVYASGEYPDEDTFDYEHFGLNLLEAQLMDPQQRKFLELCFEALYLAGYPSAKNQEIHRNTGIFAGMSSSRYADLVRQHPDKINTLGSFATSLGLEKDYLATRVAHKLNLGGPALNINTACSTSLVAIIQAVESLRAFKCDMALAGGIAIANLNYEGHTYNDGSIYSKNNECRVFDSHATGTIFTHGSGVVILKRLSDALKANDNILGVIAGVGLSNDGADKMSFTGPSIPGQAKAISQALADAEISAEQILFIEAHGTGTPIGDPAEVKALSRAYNTVQKQYCFISSLKANAGHLNAAAGVAGLIKAIQVLQTNILPGQIHIDQVNPLLKLNDSPFKITTENRLLSLTSERRFAGISSFGVGGTNAHVILESYSPKDQSDDHITLVFSGFGSQYTNLGHQLISQYEDLFKVEIAEIDNALKKNQQPLTIDLIRSTDTSIITQQLQLLIYQYLVAKVVIKQFNLKNIKVMGCSLGELTAACISGVMSLEQVITFIVQRTQFLSNAPSGAMLLINKSQQNLIAELADFDLEIAISYSHEMFSVSGLKQNILQFKERLDQRGIHNYYIESHYPYHSSKLVGFEDAIAELTTALRLNTSCFEFIKTGATDLMLTDLAYWQTHHLHKVEFDNAIKKVLTSVNNSLIVEIGPQNFLTQQIQKIAAFEKIEAEAINLSSYSIDNEIETLLFGLNQITQHFEKQRLKIKTAVLKKPTLKKTKVVLPPIQRKNPVVMQKPNSNLNSLDLIIDQLLKLFSDDLGFTVNLDQAHINQTHFLELGLDSLMLTQISSLVKTKFKTTVSFRELKEKYNTLETLASFINEKNPPLQKEFKEPNIALLETASTTPKIESATLKTAALSTSTLENIVKMQLQLMQEQINLLKGQPVNTTSSEAATTIAIPTENVTSTKVTAPPIPFGAQAKINLQSTYTQNSQVRENIKNFEKKYNHKTSLSKSFAERSRKVHADPRSVSGFRPETKEITYPIVVKKSEGQCLWDLNDNIYIDMLCGFGSNFFGNKNSHILSAMQEQLKNGIEVGPQHALTLEVAQMVVDLTGNERAAFCNTGSEAVLGAIRIARTVTAKKKIITFSGSYHGINDDVIVRAGSSGQTIPAASGICAEAVSNTVVLEYGVQSSLEYIRSNADDIAGVLVEPVQSRRCNFHPKDFLTDLRKLTTELDICLIFDEIITGFRIQAGGAQGYFNIQADLCTYGKIVGGGLPIGIIAGKSKYMNALDGGPWNFGDESYPEEGVTYFAGTFVRHPLALAACKASLEIIKNNSKDLFSALNLKSEKFVNELNQYFISEKFPLVFDQFGSLMKPRWTDSPIASEVFFALLRYHGVHTYDGFPWFINLAHTEVQLQEVIAAMKKTIVDMKSLGLFTSSYTLSHFDFVETKTPRSFIGKDENGLPATFIEDKSNPGSYIQVRPFGQ